MSIVHRTRNVFAKSGIFREAVLNDHRSPDFNHVVEIVCNSLVKTEATMCSWVWPNGSCMEPASVREVDPVGQGIPNVTVSGGHFSALSRHCLTILKKKAVTAGALLHLFVLHLERTSWGRIGRLANCYRSNEPRLFTLKNVNCSVIQADFDLHLAHVLNRSITHSHTGRNGLLRWLCGAAGNNEHQRRYSNSGERSPMRAKSINERMG